MRQTDPTRMIQEALQKHEFVDLLLGRQDYQYLPKWSPSSGTTDLAEVLRITYNSMDALGKDELHREVDAAASHLVMTYEGLWPVAVLILIESMRREDGKETFGIDLVNLANRLQASIKLFGSRLAKDRSGEGSSFPDGMLGELRRLSRIVADKCSGPAFM